MVWDTQKGVTSLFITNCIGTSLSLFGTIWNCYYFIKIGGYKNTSLRLIMLIILSDFFYAVANIMTIFDGPAPTLKPICYADAFIRTWSYTLTLFFAMCLSLFCYKSVKNAGRFNDTSFLTKCIVIGVLLCIWLTIAPTFMKQIQFTNGAICCDIIIAEQPNTVGEFMLTVLHGAIPIILFTLISIGAYIATLITATSLPKEAGDIKARIHRLFLYPAVLFLISIPGLTEIYSINFVVTANESYFILQLIHLFLTRSCGFLNALAYGIQMKSYLRKNQGDLGAGEDMTDYICDDSAESGWRVSIAMAELPKI